MRRNYGLKPKPTRVSEQQRQLKIATFLAWFSMGLAIGSLVMLFLVILWSNPASAATTKRCWNQPNTSECNLRGEVARLWHGCLESEEGLLFCILDDGEPAQWVPPIPIRKPTPPPSEQEQQ